MTRTPTALSNPALLAWARQSIGLDLPGAAKKSNLKAEQIEAWETGEGAPTIAQLRSLAKVYKRPLAVFFLPQPPRGWDAMRDFRRLPDAEASKWSPELHAEFRRAQEQREAALELLEVVGDEPSNEWQVAGRDDDALARAARSELQALALFGNPTSAQGYERFAFWASALEHAGILVLTSAGVDAKEMRGFSIHESPLPVIVVNGKDSVNGRVFSLLHEYAHLMLHTGGLCDQRVPEQATQPDRVLESRCNRIAAAILMPADEVLQYPVVAAAPNRFDGWSGEAIRKLAAQFGVSGEAALRRLVDLGKAPWSLYRARRAEWQEIYDAAGERRAPEHGDYYKTHVRNLGKGYVRLVMDAYTSRAISSYQAASYLNAKVSSLPGLARAAGVTGGG